MDIKDLPKPTTHGEVYLMEILKELRALRGEFNTPPATSMSMEPDIKLNLDSLLQKEVRVKEEHKNRRAK